jgi:hypothetical protein
LSGTKNPLQPPNKKTKEWELPLVFFALFSVQRLKPYFIRASRVGDQTREPGLTPP